MDTGESNISYLRRKANSMRWRADATFQAAFGSFSCDFRTEKIREGGSRPRLATTLPKKQCSVNVIPAILHFQERLLYWHGLKST